MNKPVTIAGFEITGAEAADYSLTQPEGVTANILALIVPLINGLTPSADGTGLLLSFSGQTGQSYQVLGATNLTLPLSQWVILTNGVFGTDIVTLTSAMTNSFQMFYRLVSP
jgi:hypothetical protein